MMKKCLSLILALCLLLAVCPAALASYNETLSGDHIRTKVTGGMMEVEVRGYGVEDITVPVATVQIPVSNSLMSARIELPYGTTYEWINFSAKGVHFAFNEQDMNAYGLNQLPDSEEKLQDALRQKDRIIYTRNLDANTDWKSGQYNASGRQELFGSVYETTFALQAGASVSDGQEEAKHFLPSARATWFDVVCDIEPVFFRYFITNGPNIAGTEYNAEQGKLYDTLRKQGSEEDWSVTFEGAADQLANVVFGDSELNENADYSVENVGGNMKLTLKGGFLKNLPAGYHKIELSFSSNAAASSNELFKTALLINVVSEQPAVPAPSVPTTGDNTQLLLWSALLCASLGVSVWMFGRSRKKATR